MSNDFQLIDDVIEKINSLKDENKKLKEINTRLEHNLRVTRWQNESLHNTIHKLETRIFQLERGGFVPIKHQEFVDNILNDSVYTIELHTLYGENLECISSHYRVISDFVTLDLPNNIYVCTLEEDEKNYKLLNKVRLLEIIEQQNTIIQQLQLSLESK